MGHYLPKLVTLLAAAALLLAYACGGAAEAPTDGGDDASPGANDGGDDGVPSPSAFPGITSEVVVPNADVPIALAFAPDGRLFYAEQNTGAIRIVSADGQLLATPFAQVEVAVGPGWGLLGLAIDPDFETSHYVYAYLTRPAGANAARPVVERFTEVNNAGTGRTTIINDFPQAELYGEYAIGGDITFGPDGFLYVTVGDHISTDLAQDLGSMRGKILRVDAADGSAPLDNPFVDDLDADPRVFAYGFLDPHDLAFQPDTGDLFASENGTYFCCDELDVVRGGENYGWPEVGPEQSGILPVHFFAFPNGEPIGTKVHPEGIAFVSSSAYPALGDALLACEQDTGYMRQMVLAPSGATVESDDVVVADCTSDVAVSPDGTVYYSNGSEIRRLITSAE